MLTALVLGQLVGLSPPGFKSALSLSERTEARVRSNVGTAPAFDFETIPSVFLGVTGRRSGYAVGYSPRFTWVDLTGDLTGDPQFVLMHTGFVGASFWGRRTRLTLSASGSLGTQSAAGLAVDLPVPTIPGPATPGGDNAGGPPALKPVKVTYVLPPSQILNFGSGNVGFGVSETLSRRWTGSVSGYYAVSGGRDYFAQQVVPPNRGGGGSVGATYHASRQDTLTSTVGGNYYYVLTTTNQYFVTSAVESLNHTWSRHTAGTLGAGVALLVQEVGGRKLSGGVFGVGNAGISYSAPLSGHATWTSGLNTLVAQTYNPILARIDNVAAATAYTGWSRDKFGLTGSVASGTSLPPTSGATRTVSGGLTVSYTPVEPVVLQTGVRVIAQLLPGAADATFPPQWAAFVAVLLKAPPVPL